jgi:hypothetical protein
MAIALVQAKFRFRTDASAVDTAATWGAAENTNWNPSITPGDKFRLRFTINSTGSTASASAAWNLRVSKNGGAFTAITTTTRTLGVIAADASASADNTAITTNQLTAGSGTRVNGQYDETGGTGAFALGATSYMELEYGLQVVPGTVAIGDTLDFRVYNGTTALNTYTVTPRLTVASAQNTGTDDDGVFEALLPVATASDLTGTDTSQSKALVSSTDSTTGYWTAQSLGAQADAKVSWFTSFWYSWHRWKFSIFC